MPAELFCLLSIEITVLHPLFIAPCSGYRGWTSWRYQVQYSRLLYSF